MESGEFASFQAVHFETQSIMSSLNSFPAQGAWGMDHVFEMRCLPFFMGTVLPQECDLVLPRVQQGNQTRLDAGWRS